MRGGYDPRIDINILHFLRKNKNAPAGADAPKRKLRLSPNNSYVVRVSHKHKRSLHFSKIHLFVRKNIILEIKKSVLPIRTVRIVWQGKCNTLFAESQIYSRLCREKYVKPCCHFFAPSILLTYVRLCGTIFTYSIVIQEKSNERTNTV